MPLGGSQRKSKTCFKMTYELILQEEAGMEILEAYIYYEDAQKGFGKTFMKHMDNTYAEFKTIQYIFSLKKITEKLLFKSSRTSSFLTLLITKSLCFLFSTLIKTQQKSRNLFEHL